MEPGGGAGKLAAADRPLTAEEEAMKRNTDCVYFLASPLTCKKGSECEYRHSESARLNPRDCRYWLYGNCSNPNCLYRHPPLDGLYGLPGTTPAPSSQTVVTTQTLPGNAPASYNHKKNTACYYFQMRQCMKGDRCPYMHGPQPTGTSVPQKVGKVSASLTESPQTLKEAWLLKKCIQQETPKASVDKPNEVLPSAAKPVTRAEINPSNGLALGRNPSSYPLVNELPRSQPINDPASSGIAISMSQSHQSHPREECLQNSKDADELLGESSPGFDVLVDNDIEDTDYLQNEHDFGRESVQGGRDLFSATDFNYDESDYEPVASYEKDHYNGMDGYDSYRRLHNSYGREQQRPSSEKTMGRQKMPERRVRQRESPDEMDSSDLRHQLLKQRRISGLRSTVGPNHCSEPFHNDAHLVEGERYSGNSHKVRQCFHSERSASTRLQGRITLPGSSSTYRLVDSRPDREWDRVRHSNRLSPGRPINYPERHDRVRHSNRLSPGRPINYPDRHDRVKRRIHEHFAADTRKFGGQNIRRDNRNSLDFAGPKSLAELKNQQQSVKSRITARLSPEPSMKLGKPLNFPESDVSLSFEGPKPLSDILKTKRENAPENSEISSNDGNNHSGSAAGSSESATVSDHQRDRSPEAIKGLDSATNIQMSKVGSFEESEYEEGLIPEAGEYAQSPAKDTVEMEEGQMVTDENRELQNFDQINKWDYEAAEGGDAKPEDDDNYYQEDEELYDEDDDEDDFARKVGVMFS